MARKHREQIDDLAFPSSPFDDADLELMLVSEFGPRTHTPECAAQMAEDNATREAWLAHYGATHCQHCAMSGVEWSVHFDEPPTLCPHCTGRGRCAQCGAPFDIDTQERCPSCGWHEGIEIPTGGWCMCQPVEIDLGEPPF